MKPFLPTFSMCSRSRQKGAALIVVLAMLVLLLGILGAFLSRSGTNRDTSASSASLTAVDLLASVAIDQVVGDLKQEIEDGSKTPFSPPNGGDPLYLPETPQNAIPQLRLRGLTAGDLVGSGMENLIGVSGDGSSTPTDEPSRNGRSITPERWNKPLLMKRTASNGSNDSPPANFPTPQWILVARDGTSPTSLTEARWSGNMTNRKTVIGRYAYVVYNQGGLLDANVAGYPASANATITGTNINNPVRFKPSAAYADLTIPEIGLTQAQVDTLIEDWRNEATFAAPDPATEYFKLNLQNESGFLSTSNKSAPGGATDRMFIGRRQLIDFFKDKLDLNDSAGLDALQYFTTFSRSLNQPTFYRMQGSIASLPNYHASAPKISNWNLTTSPFKSLRGVGNSAFGDEPSVNPIIPSVTMAGAGTRFDGTPFSSGEPILKKRFPLDRLVWVTYKGPSATLSMTDPLIAALEAEGITREFLQQGTAANIEKAFGLRWNPGPGTGGLGGYWTYDVHFANVEIDILANVAAQRREPNFFELLKSAIDVGGIGRAFHGWNAGQTSDLAYLDQMRKDSNVDFHIIQIGANMIDQVAPENFPTQIVIEDSGVGNRSFLGTVDLPYFYGAVDGAILVNAPVPAVTLADANRNIPENDPQYVTALGTTTSGVGVNGDFDATWINTRVTNGDITPATGAAVVIQTPILWNPHRSGVAVGASLTPSLFRVNVTTTSAAHLRGSAVAATGYRIGMLTEAPGGQTDYRRRILPLPTTNQQRIGATFIPHLQTDWASSGVSLDADTGMIEFSTNHKTAIRFEYSNQALFRQPIPLLQDNVPTGLQLSLGPGHGLRTTTFALADVRDFSNGVPEAATGRRYFGFYIGRVPLRWNAKRSTAFRTETTTIENAWFDFPANKCFTYSVEYSPDGGSSWIPYQQITQPVINFTAGDFFHNIQVPWESNPSVPVNRTSYFWNRLPYVERWNNFINTRERSEVPSNHGMIRQDPRSNRWASGMGNPIPGFIDLSNRPGELSTARAGAALGLPRGILNPPGANANPYSYKDFEGGASSKTTLVADTETWHESTWSGIGLWGLISGTPAYLPFEDPDGVARRPMGAWVPNSNETAAQTTVGLPLADGGALATGTNRFNRPVILHRPFRSIAELSYVFTDTPWRQIDFFTPESPFTGLLDVFTTSETQSNSVVVAGKVDLNTRQLPVLKSLLAGAYRDSIEQTSNITSNDAETLAQALIDRTSSSAPGKGPLWNLAHLVGRFDPNANTAAVAPQTGGGTLRFDGYSADLGASAGGSTAPENLVQTLREAPIRALVQNGQAGTWNLLVDVIAQTGKFAGTSDEFTVEAEKRIWLHLAVDRLTGKVIDSEIEVITE